MDGYPYWAWGVFVGTIVPLLVLDLFVHRGGRAESHRWAIVWAVIWVIVGLAFVGFVWLVAGGISAQEYLATYLIEKGLSLDNLFVFLIIFQSLNIPDRYQRTALTWGIFGALVFRAIFVVIGAAALRRWQWIEYVFGAILFYAAYHAFREDPQTQERSRLVSWLAERLPVTEQRETHHFIIREGDQRKVTPLLISVLALEVTDIIFAIDSVPAALSISRAEFIVYSSNAFAILGLRSLYIVMAKTIVELKYLHYGLAAVLAFAGLKLTFAHWIEISPLISIGVIVVCMGGAIGASLWERKNRREYAGQR